jgi:hypothetical protein
MTESSFSDLNQYAVSQVLGSTMKPIGQLQFGNFGLLRAAANVLSAKEVYLSTRRRSGLSPHEDHVAARAFEDVRDGCSPDSLLWDKHLLRRYLQRCRELGLQAPDAVLTRRIITIRKNSKRFAKQGIALSPTTRNDPQPSVISKYAHVIEFTLVRLRYRFGVSIDEILLEPLLGDEYERLCLEIAPELSPQQIRLAALYLRKTRFLARKTKAEVLSLDIAKLERRWTTPTRLSELNLDQVPDQPGLFELCEKNRHLYVARVDDIRSPAAMLKDPAGPLSIVSSAFWHPEANSISLRYVAGAKIDGVSLRVWEHRLIHDLRPTLNWPIQEKGSVAA